MTTRVRAGIALAAAFAAGMAAGVLLAGAIAREPAEPDIMPPLSKLDLDARQRREARRIIEAHRPELEEALAPSMPRVREVQDRVEEELRRILTEEQRERLERLRASGEAGPPALPR